MRNTLCDLWGQESRSDSRRWRGKAMTLVWCLALLSVLFGPAARAEPDQIPVWWSAALAAQSEDALDQSLYEPLQVTLRHRQTGITKSAEDCFDTADLLERGYRPAADMAQQDVLEAYLCLARRIIAAAAIPKTSHLRTHDDGAPPLAADDMKRLPAMLGPGQSCALRAVSHLTGNDWYSIARFFHIYMGGQKDDYREERSIVTNPDLLAADKLLVAQDGPDRLILTTTTHSVSLMRLGFGDVNGDGIDDMLLLRVPEQGLPQLAVLTKVRAESLISPLNRTDIFLDFSYSCPDEAVTLIARHADKEGCN